MPTAYLRPIFVKGDITDPMGLVLDVPVPPDQRQQPRRLRTLQRQTRDTHDNLCPHYPRLFEDNLAFEGKHLCQAWPRTIACEDITGLEAALFDPSVPHIDGLSHCAGLIRPRRLDK